MGERAETARALLAFERVDIRYGGPQGPLAVRGASLSVAPGEVVGIVGASGSGKSTLLKAAMGLLDAGGAVTAGSIRYDGRDLATLAPEQLRALRGPEMALVFQDCLASLCPQRTIGAQAWEMARAHGAPRGRAARRALEGGLCETLARIGIAEPERVLSSRPYELSGGMGQRVGIALALMLHPRLVLADEPTSALDVTTQAQVVEELRRARERQGCAMLVVTHSMGVAAALCDRVCVLERGRVVEQGATAAVLGAPQAAYTRELIAAAPRIGDAARDGGGAR